MPANNITIKIATPSNASDLLKIYAPYVLNTSITYEYEVPSVEEFTNRIKKTLEKYPYLIAVESYTNDTSTETNDISTETNENEDFSVNNMFKNNHSNDTPTFERIVGYAYASSFHTRAAYAWDIETSIYVDMNHKGKGIGKMLYDKLEEILKKQNILKLYACIAYTEIEDKYLTNASVDFHKHLGYSLTAHFPKCAFKFNKWYDMVWMEKTIGEQTKEPKAFIPFGSLINI